MTDILKQPLLSGHDNGAGGSLSIQVAELTTGAMNHQSPITRSPQITRPKTELIIPDFVQTIRLRSRNATENAYDTSTISLSRDIFTTIAVLKAYHIWDDIDKRHRRQLLILAFICIVLQFGLLCTLSIEVIISPPWRRHSSHYALNGGGGSLLIIITKFFCVFAVLIYLFKELYELKAYRKARREIQNFRSTCSNLLFWIYNLYNLSLYIMAMALSVVLISTSLNGFDAVLNAVAILFVLDIDNWLYSMIKSHEYIEDKLFDIKYEKHKQVTSYLIAKYRYLSSICRCCCSLSYSHKAAGDQTFISLLLLFVWFAMIISMSLICLGLLNGDDMLKNVGVVSLCVVAVCYMLRNGFNIIASFCFKCKNKRKIHNFIDEELPVICHQFVQQIHAAKVKQNSDAIDKIKSEFVQECFRFFDKNICGVKETSVSTTEKLIFALDEYYNKCDKTRIQTSHVDFGAIAFDIDFTL